MIQGITNGKFITPEGIIFGTVMVEGGKIQAIQVNKTKGHEYFDAKGGYVLPGLIETHGHLREPGLTHKEDIEHGTRAALAGGFTTIFDMPNTKPPTTTVKLLHEQIARYKEHSLCDFAINFGTSVEDIGELEGVNPKEIVGAKVFMAGHETTPTTVTRREDQSKIWEIAGRRGFPILAHAEDQELVSEREAMFQKQGRTDLLAYSEARDESVVVKACKIAVDLAIKHGTALWILHASTRGEFEAIDYARAQGVKAGGEVTGYQLFFTTDDYDRLGTRIKVSPALRSPEVNAQLWELVRAGSIDGICSEHTPHLLSEKEGDIWEAASGMPGLQETVAGFITGWVKHFGRDSLEEGLLALAKCASTNVASFFSYPQKSGVKVGNDADFVIIDVENPWKVGKEDLFTKCGWSAYEGMELVGRPVATFRRGELMYEHGRISGKSHGQWLVKGGLS
ncbi:MAG: Dihydroorotase [Candidatus Gottesmanbacteria bacterium GW2011_GWA2_47_9]|uniref:Dihydroorotase n=1 Tax=Candidatus Gottesmanbacteria bacterium GW2011_GWA2_47_9 TaxID=1618445 RepID=A0A0G1U050_9BACT|nr:MAG: Dihydroorotase [Candidatus Gottesmanbacteria bacterium GW2011_GWA2_47_9]